MKKLLLVLAILTVCMYSSAQTGPGGVGSTDGTSNLVLWLDVNTETNPSGTLPVWHDRSGNSNDANPPTSTAQATFVSSSVNGYPSLDFDGTNDEYRIIDNATIDLTQWHIFIVPIVDLAKNYNAWLVKGNDAQENYELLSYNTNNIHTPIRFTSGARNALNTPANQVSATNFNVVEYSFSSAGRDMYTNGINVANDNESRTPRVNNLPLYVGNERGRTGRNINGDLAEVFMYNAPLNSAQRIIVNNYLAAKYGRPTANDVYNEDNVANGNYDHDVAGIGRVNASNLHNDAQGTGIVRILNPTGLGNNEFLMWGHDNGTLSFTNTDVPANISNRLARVWRVSEVNTSGTAVDVGNIDMRFNLTGAGTVTASDLRLLIDTDNDGVFADETPISGATSLGGNVYQFAGVSAIANNLRFTLALNCVTRSTLTQTVCDSLRSPSGNYLWISTGTYRDTIPNTAGCDSIMTFNLTVNYSSTITLSQDTVAICQGDDSAVFTFTGTTNNPDRYSIDFNSAAEAAGFTDVTGATLSGSSFTVTVPTGAAVATYDANLTVKNATENCPSSQYGIHIVIRRLPNPGNIQSQ